MRTTVSEATDGHRRRQDATNLFRALSCRANAVAAALSGSGAVAKERRLERAMLLVLLLAEPAHSDDELDGRAAKQIQELRGVNVAVGHAVVGAVRQMVNAGSKRPTVTEKGHLPLAMDIEIEAPGQPPIIDLAELPAAVVMCAEGKSVSRFGLAGDGGLLA